jgi:hypothetical protein
MATTTAQIIKKTKVEKVKIQTLKNRISLTTSHLHRFIIPPIITVKLTAAMNVFHSQARGNLSKCKCLSLARYGENSSSQQTTSLQNHPSLPLSEMRMCGDDCAGASTIYKVKSVFTKTGLSSLNSSRPHIPKHLTKIYIVLS